MARWFRMYDEMLDDPKVQMLSPELFKTWINLLAVASRNNGILPTVEKLSFALRVSKHEMQSRIEELVLAELIDIRADKKLEPHNWQQRQWKSDDSAERVRKHRASKQSRNDDVTVTVTPPEADTETDTEADNLALAPSARAEGSSFNNFGFGKPSRCVSQRLRSKAEGLGLPVDELCRRATEPHVEVPNAMFRHLCVDHLQKIVPRAPRKMLAAALTRDGDAAFASVCQLILENT